MRYAVEGLYLKAGLPAWIRQPAESGAVGLLRLRSGKTVPVYPAPGPFQRLGSWSSVVMDQRAVARPYRCVELFKHQSDHARTD